MPEDAADPRAQAGKAVVTATQLLNSMLLSPKPTRAEVPRPAPPARSRAALRGRARAAAVSGDGHRQRGVRRH
jgi:hypothetical protein